MTSTTKSLFQITDEMANLIEYGCSGDGEIATTQEEFNKMYDEIQLELTTKLDNTNGLIKSINSDVDLIDTEIKRLQALKKDRENKAEWLKRRIDFIIRQQFTNEDGDLDLIGLNAYKLKLPHSSISYRKSNSVAITNLNLVPTEMKTVKVEEIPSKIKIKEYLESINATECDYAKIQTSVNISIK